MDSIFELVQSYVPVLNVCCARRKPVGNPNMEPPTPAPNHTDGSSYMSGNRPVSNKQDVDDDEEENDNEGSMWGAWGEEEKSSSSAKKTAKVVEDIDEDSDSEFEEIPIQAPPKKPVLPKSGSSGSSSLLQKPVASVAAPLPSKVANPLVAAKPVILTKKEDVAPVNTDDLFGELNMAPVFKTPVVVATEQTQSWAKKESASSKLLSASEVVVFFFRYSTEIDHI